MIPHGHNPLFTPLTLLLLLTTLLLPPTAAISNLTSILSSYPSLSTFTSLLLSSPSLSSSLSHRSSLTLLAVPNDYLPLDLTRRLSPSSLSDLLSYHILLEFFSWSSLHHIPPQGTLVATLFQTTGRAPSNLGSVNVTFDKSTNKISINSPSPFSPSNTTVLQLIKTLPYNLTILSVNSFLIPYDFHLMASEANPPLGLNITKALLNAHNFNVAASMLTASGVVSEFEADEGGSGITLFVPTDSAFSDLPPSVTLQSLPADKKAVVLRFHVLHSYYPLGSLESIVNPVQPTLATEDMGAGRFTLNISRVNGSVAIDSGIVQASVTQTVFDQNPVAIFGVSKVLLPKEIFAAGESPSKPEIGNADAPLLAEAPESYHLVSPPGSSGDLKSEGFGKRFYRFDFGLCCLGLSLLF